jgi:ribosome-binding protein aMBF1 (putative translation factor)
MSEPTRQRKPLQESVRTQIGRAIAKARRRRRWSQSELARSFTAIGRLLKPWLDRLRSEPARSGKSQGLPAS